MPYLIDWIWGRLARVIEVFVDNSDEIWRVPAQTGPFPGFQGSALGSEVFQKGTLWPHGPLEVEWGCVCGESAWRV